jgi:hypothetical protein
MTGKAYAGAIAQEASVERREVARFLMQCPAIFEWRDEHGQSHSGAGFTRDISASGVFILSAHQPPTGSWSQIEVLLPAQQQAEQGLKLSSNALVTRVEGTGEAKGFAAASEFAIVGEREFPPVRFGHAPCA